MTYDMVGMVGMVGMVEAAILCEDPKDGNSKSGLCLAVFYMIE
jgi:hypothetical protein